MRAATIAGAAGGRVAATKPTLAYNAVGQFRITNYNPSLTYTITCTVGTASRSDDIVTMTNTNSIATITSSSPKSVAASAPSTYERKAYSYYFTQGYRCCPSPGGCECGNPAGCEFCSDWFSEYCYNNFSGSGYTWNGAALTCNGGTCSGSACATPNGEWVKIG